MRKKSLIILAGIVLVGIVSILALTQNRPTERIVVDNLNKAISNYTNLNIKEDKTYSLKVSDVQMLITTYTPEYTLFVNLPNAFVTYILKYEQFPVMSVSSTIAAAITLILIGFIILMFRNTNRTMGRQSYGL